MGIKMRILLSLAMLLILAYLCTAFTVFSKKPVGRLCTDIQVITKDTTFSDLFTARSVGDILKQAKLNPIGKDIDSVNTMLLERTLGENALIDKVECYKTPSGKIRIEISQKTPVLRVFNNSGENFLVDDKGSIMPQVLSNAFHLPVVTGYASKTYCTNRLYEFGVFLQQDPFWNAQVEQINVVSGNNIEIVPRVGNHIIYLGQLDDYEQKLRRVEKFYSKALNKIGWNKYERINVELSNQIICTKRK